MYYNVDALKAAGFETAPATWEELRNASKAVTKDGAKGYGISLGDSWYYLAMMLTAGGQVYNDAGNGIGFAAAGEAASEAWFKPLPGAIIAYLLGRVLRKPEMPLNMKRWHHANTRRQSQVLPRFLY